MFIIVASPQSVTIILNNSTRIFTNRRQLYVHHFRKCISNAPFSLSIITNLRIGLYELPRLLRRG